VLDEPTNDLDIETLELLEELIGAFDGTVLLVTHDRVFLDNVVTSTLAFEGEGRVVEYVGGYEDYLRQRSDFRLKPEATAAKAVSRPDVASGFSRKEPTRRKKTYKEEREYEALPARIETLEHEQRRLQDEVASPDFYKSGADHIRAVLARIDEIHATLEDALARWVELEEIGR
jgi:ABC transport system ATP-binding/permease protein